LPAREWSAWPYLVRVRARLRVRLMLRLRLRLRFRARVRVRVRFRAGHTPLLHQLQALGPPLDHAVERELDRLTCARLGSGLGVGVG